MQENNLDTNLQKDSNILDESKVASYGNSFVIDKTSSVFDVDTNRMFNVPNIFDEIDTRFAIDVQANKANKGDYLMKTNVSGIYGEVLKPVTDLAKGLARGAVTSFSDIYSAELAKAGRGDTTVLLMLENLSNLGESDEEKNQRQQEMINESYRVRDKTKNFIDKSGLNVEGILPDLGAALGSTAVFIGMMLITKNPLLSVGFATEVSRASNYLEAIDNGASEDKALWASNLAGLGEGAVEYIGLNGIFKVLKASAPITRKLNRYAMTFLEAGAINAAEEAVQGGQEELFMQTLGERDRTRVETVKSIAYQGLLGFMAGSSIGVTTKFVMDNLGKNPPENMTTEEITKMVNEVTNELYQNDDILNDVINLVSKELDPSTEAYDPESFMSEVKKLEADKRETIVQNLIAKGNTPEAANKALDDAINKVNSIQGVKSVEMDVAGKLMKQGFTADQAQEKAKVYGAMTYAHAKMAGMPVNEYYNKHAKLQFGTGKEGGLEQGVLTPQQKEFFKNTKVVDEKGEPLVVYHGGVSGIETFDLKYLGKQGMSEGTGFYFTDSKDVAKQYADNRNGELYSVFINMKKPITNLNQKKITKSQLKKVFSVLYSKDNDALSNYGDVSYEGYEYVLNNAVDIEFDGSESDIDLIASLGNSGIADRQLINDAFTKVTGYDGVILSDSWVKEHGGNKLIVAFNPNQIKEISNVAPTEDKNIYKQEGLIKNKPRGSILPTSDGYIINLFEEKNLSTFLHEAFGHLFTLELKRMSEFSKSAKAKWDTLSDYYGYAEGNTKEDNDDALERMARAFEAYFMEGKSPNKRLAGAFESFKKWLIDIYKSFSTLNVYVSDEVKTVFDAMVGGKSIDEVFSNEGTRLNTQLNEIREGRFERLFRSQITSNDITEYKSLISGLMNRVKQLSDGIKELTKKEKNPIIAISNEFGIGRLKDIENTIKMQNMRIPAKPKTLANVLRGKKVGGINAAWAKRLGLIDKDYDKSLYVKEGGIDNENNLVSALQDLGFMPNIASESYDQTSQQWEEAVNLLENADEVSSDLNKSEARKIALDTRNSASEYIGRMFPDISDDKILSMIDDYRAKNGLYDKISKGGAKDIRSIIDEINGNIKSLTKAIKEDNKQTISDVKQVIIDLISDLPKVNRADFITKIKNIDTVKKLNKELPDIVDKIQDILESNFTKRIDKKIRYVLKASKPNKSNGRLSSKFDNSEFQLFMDNANRIMKLSKSELENDLNLSMALIGKEIISEQQAFDNMLMEVALGVASPETYIDVYNSIRDVYENGKISGEAAKLLRAEEKQRLLEGTTEVIKSQEKSIAMKVSNKLLNSFVAWEDILDVISSGDKTSKTGEGFISNELGVFKQELQERKTSTNWLLTLEEFMKNALGVKDSRAVSKYITNLGKVYELGTFTFKNKDATGEFVTKDVSMTKDQMIDFYMKKQDSIAYRNILDENGNAYPEDLINTIESYITAEDVRVANAIFEFYLDTRDEVFEYNRIQTGISLKPRLNYSPRYSDMVKEIKAEVNSIQQATAGSGRFKETSDVVYPIKFAGAFNTVNKYIIEVSNYMAWQNKLRDLNNVFTDKNIRTYIKERFGESVNKAISGHIQKFANRGKVYSDLAEDVVARLRNNYSFSVLALNPSLFFKQVTSFVAYADEIPTIDFMAGIAEFIANPKKAIDILKDSTFVKNRAKDFTLEVKELNESAPVRNFLNNPNFRNMLMLATSLGDRASIFLGGYPVYRYWRKQGLTHEEAIYKFEVASNSTQQSSYLSQQTPWQTNNVGKLFSVFTSAQSQYFRKELSAIRGLMTGRMSYDKALKRIAIYHFILPMFFQLMVNLGRWDDKDEARAAMLGSLEGVFILGDMLGTLIATLQNDYTFPSNIPFIQELNSAFKALAEVIKSIDDVTSEDFLDAVKDLTSASGNLAGYPIEKLYNMWEGAMDIMDKEYVYGAEKLLGWTPWVVKDQKGGLPKIIADEIE